MRTVDLTPYRRMTVGFDRIFDMLESNQRQPGDNYPPFDLERLDEDRYRITVAVAGFRREDLEITSQENLLLVTGERAQPGGSDQSQYLHVGIAARSFERRFELADFIRVRSADLADGLLTIELVREVPDAMKPRTIDIGSSKPAIEGEAKAEGETG